MRAERTDRLNPWEAKSRAVQVETPVPLNRQQKWATKVLIRRPRGDLVGGELSGESVPEIIRYIHRFERCDKRWYSIPGPRVIIIHDVDRRRVPNVEGQP